MKEKYECENCGREFEELFKLGKNFVCKECFDDIQSRADFKYDRQREEGLI